MSAKLLFYYFGDDEAYFRALQGEFGKHAKSPIEFKRIYESREIKIQSLFLNVFNDKPACVFIDFSKNTQDYLHLARLISRTTLEVPMLMVGLVDYLSPPEVLKESILTGTNLNFIKSAEIYDVAFGVIKLVTPTAPMEHGFAKATLDDELEAGVLCKVGYVSTEGIHVETDQNLGKGDRLTLNHHWTEKRVVPSKHVFVRAVSNTNMFYQFQKNADLDFMFIDEVPVVEGMAPETVIEKNGERDELIAYHKKQLKKWIEENKTSALEKRTKVLVVDYNFRFYQDQPRTDKHAYTIRCIPNFNDISEQIDRLKPQIIAYEIGEKNTFDGLKQLVKILGSMFSNLKPYIIVFNSPEDSNGLQETLKNPQIMAHKEPLIPELVIKMADALHKKMMMNPPVSEETPRVFLKKTHPSSVAEIHRSVKVIKLSETDLILQSDYPFETGVNIHFTKPVEMFVNLQPNPKPSGKLPEYYGLIHSMGENDKKELRKYVNTIFFRDHDAIVSTEAEEFKKLNDLKLQERIAQALKVKADLEAKLKEKAAAEAPEKTKEPEAG